MNTGLILAKLLLSASIITHSFPAESKDMKNTFENASSLFVKEIQIEKDDNLPTMDFSKIFGTNPTDESKNKPFGEEKKDMILKVLNAKDDFIAILKIGDKSVLINAGKPENFQTVVLPSIGALKISKLDAVIFLNPNDNFENILTIADMNLTKRVLIPNITPEENEDRAQVILNLKTLEDKLKEKNMEVKKVDNDTSIQLGRINMNMKMFKKSTRPSLLIENNENTIFIAGEISKEKQENQEFVLPEVNTLVLETQNTLTKKLIEKTKPKSLVLIERSKQYTPEEKKIISEFLEKHKDRLFVVNPNIYIDMILESKASELEVKKVNAQSNISGN